MNQEKTQSKPGKIYIGTSGWVYKSWHDVLYPKNMKKGFLSFYAQHFPSVEINTSFYHLPRKSTYEKWHDETPETFRFASKISRYITHIKKLKGVKASLKRFFDAARGADDKLIAILVQLPPKLAFNEKDFKDFLNALDSTRKQLEHVGFALEPRHLSWFEGYNVKVIRQLVKKHDLALVFAHSSIFPKYNPEDPENVTSDLVYIRFHGPKEFAASKYGKKLLEPWAEYIKKWAADGKTICAYFNDDVHGYAVHDAKDLMELCNLTSPDSRNSVRLGMARKYGKKAQQEVKTEMHEMKRGRLHSGRSGKKVTNPKQAIAIGLSKARKKGAKVPKSPKKNR